MEELSGLVLALMIIGGLFYAGYVVTSRLGSEALANIQRETDAAVNAEFTSPEPDLRATSASISNARRRAVLIVLIALVILVASAAAFRTVWVTYGSYLNLLLTIAGIGFSAAALTRGVVMFALVGRNKYALSAIMSARENIVGSIQESRFKGAAVERLLNAERAEAQFAKNLRAVHSIKQLEMQNAGIFRDLRWGFEPGVNVLLGRNGYGKSYLLRILVAMLSYDNDRLATLLKTESEQSLTINLLKDGDAASIRRGEEVFEVAHGKIPTLAIPDSRFVDRNRTAVSAEGDDFWDMKRFGAHRFLYDLPYDLTIQTVLTQICIDAIGRRANRRRPPESPQLSMISNVMQALAGEVFNFSRIDSVGSGRFSILLETGSSPGQPIPLQQASQGTLSVVAIFGLIFQYLRSVHETVDETILRDQSAIVLIDEIDAHLHPVWQQKIVYLLRQYFPNVQFILTAHSPLVVAGCRHGEVSVLHREGNQLNIKEFQRDFIGVPPEEIYRNIFEIEDSDPVALAYRAEAPRIKEIQAELDGLIERKSPDADRIATLQSMIEYIGRAKDLESRPDYAAITRENEQLRRQLNAMRANKQDAPP